MNNLLHSFNHTIITGITVMPMMAVMMVSCGSDEPGVPTEVVETPTDTDGTVRMIEIKAVIGDNGRGGIGFGNEENGYGRVMAQEDEATRTTKFFWEVGDEIGIYTTSPSNTVTFKVQEVKDGVATLTGEIEIKDGETLHGVYPRFAIESDAMTVQKGTLNGVGDCLLMTASNTFNEEEGMTLMFHHEASLMTFNLTFPQSVTSVTELRLENALSRYSFTASGLEVLGSEPITIAGPLSPDSDGLLAVHVVMLPGSKFNTFNLTCTTNEGDYRMPPMTSGNTATAGKNHRTSRTMMPYSPYTVAVVDQSGTATAIENIQHDNGTIKWTSEANLNAGAMISVCNEGVWKCFHELTQEDITRGNVMLPDVNAGCTIDATDPTRNDWVTALCMGGNVSISYDSAGATKPLYWATGNLVAIDLGDGETAFRLATLDEMEASQSAQSPFRHNPDASGAEGITTGAMWDLFLYGDPTGRKATSSFTTPTSNIAGKSTDIAHVALKYSWRLPYVPQALSSTSTTNSKTNEQWALKEDCQYTNGWLTHGSNRLFFPFAGTYSPSSWNYVGKEAYIMTGNVSSKGVVYIWADSSDFTSTSESPGPNNSSAFNVRPVTD